MTGKEDFITYEEASILENLVKRYEEDLVKTKHELSKYKRAFEILKDLVVFDKENQAVANGTSIIDLSKEEAELLEELLKS